MSLHAYMDDRAEANGVAEQIRSLSPSHPSRERAQISYDDIAVLYRTNAQSRAFEGELRKRNIPYRIYGGTSFYQRKEIKDTLGYFRLAVNPRDNEALLRIIGFPGRGIGDTTMKKVAANAIEHHRSYLEVMRYPAETGLDVNSATMKKLLGFAELMAQLHQLSEETDAYTFAEQTLHIIGVQSALAMDVTAEGIDRAQNVQELLNAIREFVAQRQEEGIDYTPITDFLGEVSLQTDQDDNLTDTTERVTLMTVHAAKGLEFPIVFIAGMEENLFPSQFCVKPSEIEEERRLLYVAITRAMERCYLSYARQRFRNGQMAFNSPSRFLNDIDRRYMEIVRTATPIQPERPRWSNQTWGERMYAAPTPEWRHEEKTPAATSATAKAISGATNNISSAIWKEGERVSHRVFGEGVVVRVYRDEVTDNDKIEVNFDQSGTKTLLLTYAKLERI